MLPEVINTASTDCPTIELFGGKLESTQKFQMSSLCYIRGV